MHALPEPSGTHTRHISPPRGRRASMAPRGTKYWGSTLRVAALAVACLAVSLAVSLLAPAAQATAGAACPEHEKHRGEPVAQLHGARSRHGATHSLPARSATRGAPKQVGEAAFAAITEIVQRFENDPATDWHRVDIDQLRLHLRDMHLVMVAATVERRALEGGFEAVLSGDVAVRAALSRMLPAHAAMINGHRGWQVEVMTNETTFLLRVTAADAAEAARIRALGFGGFLVAGDHHRPHHLRLAMGDDPHAEPAQRAAPEAGMP